jgi:hypothetical protein
MQDPALCREPRHDFEFQFELLGNSWQIAPGAGVTRIVANRLKHPREFAEFVAMVYFLPGGAR